MSYATKQNISGRNEKSVHVIQSGNATYTISSVLSGNFLFTKVLCAIFIKYSRTISITIIVHNYYGWIILFNKYFLNRHLKFTLLLTFFNSSGRELYNLGPVNVTNDWLSFDLGKGVRKFSAPLRLCE